MIPEPGERIAAVALGDRVDSANAPHPSNDGERLLFRQLYETLVRIDCTGRVLPALAHSWRLGADERTWIVTLREDARFSDGTPVTAAGVRASWARDGLGSELRPQVSRLVESVDPVDDRTLAITLRSTGQGAPLVLAHTDLAIARRVTGSAWPLGTRSTQASSDGAAVVVTTTPETRAPIRFLAAAGDPRDLLDTGIDLLVTRNPAVLQYAATLPQFQSVPLAWQRTYVLVTPGRTRASPVLSEGARQTLADDAIRGEARGAVGPFWWQMLPGCDAADRRREDPPSSSTGRIVYDASDGAARDLAERFVGLVAGSDVSLDALLPDRPPRTFQRATGLTGDALILARRRGADAGYIVPIDRRPLDPCLELQLLVDGAPWLDPETVVPLVDTRVRAIVRRGRSGIEEEWDGGLRLASVNGPDAQ